MIEGIFSDSKKDTHGPKQLRGHRVSELRPGFRSGKAHFRNSERFRTLAVAIRYLLIADLVLVVEFGGKDGWPSG